MTTPSAVSESTLYEAASQCSNGMGERVYKFRSWDDDNHKRLITNGEVFLSSPRHFNDPFDCRVFIDFAAKDAAGFERDLRKILIEMSPSLNRCDRRSNEREQKKLIDKLRRSKGKQESFLDEYQKYLFRYFGVFSASEVYDNVMLWSHYANGHQGFCVGFDNGELDRAVRKELPTSGVRCKVWQVSYRSEYPVLTFCDSPKHQTEHLIEFVRTKAKAWQYEQEWRLIAVGATNVKVHLPPDVIKKVILGASMCARSREELIRAVRERCPHAEVLEAVRKTRAFGLEFRVLQAA